MEMEIILKYFPDLSETQKEQFAALGDLYTDWKLSRERTSETYTSTTSCTHWALRKPSISVPIPRLWT